MPISQNNWVKIGLGFCIIGIIHFTSWLNGQLILKKYLTFVPYIKYYEKSNLCYSFGCTFIGNKCL